MVYLTGVFRVIIKMEFTQMYCIYHVTKSLVTKSVYHLFIIPARPDNIIVFYIYCMILLYALISLVSSDYIPLQVYIMSYWFQIPNFNHLWIEIIYVKLYSRTRLRRTRLKTYSRIRRTCLQ